MSDLYEQRAAAIRDLTQGEGITHEKVAAVTYSTDLFGEDRDADRVMQAIDVASNAVADPRHREAIRNALGFGLEDRGTLTERRSNLIGRDRKLSYRTLIRHEVEGAAALARLLDHVDQYMDDAASKDELLERIKDLELIVLTLAVMISDVESEASKRVPEFDTPDLFRDKHGMPPALEGRVEHTLYSVVERVQDETGTSLESF